MTSLLSILLLLFTIASCLALAQSQQCSPSLIRIRKEIHDLSDAEWRRFLVALGQLKRRPSILFNNRGRRGRRGEGSGERPDRRRPPPDNDDDNDDANNNSNRRPGRGETGDDGDDSNWPSPNGWTRPETGADGVGKNSTQINRASGLLKCSAARIRQTLHDLRSTPTFEAGMLSDQLSDTYDSLLESIGALAAAPFPLFGNDSATGNKTVERDGGQQCETLLQSALEQAPDPRFFSLDDFSALHRANRLRAHGVDEFLAWHRKFIYDFETALRTIDPTITVPYWQWSLESRRPHQSIIWRRLGGSAGRSMGGMARCVPDGPFASWRMGYVADWAPDGDDGGCIYRSFDPRNGHNPDGYVTAQSCVDGLTRQARNFMEFNRGLVVAHDRFHWWVGGSMADTRVAANDPVFYFHHSYIDKMWDDWQMRDEQRRTADYNGDSIESSLAGFSGLRVRDVMSNRQQLCVAYKQPGEQAAAIVAVPTRTTAPEVEAGMRRPQTNATLNPWLLGQMRMDPQMFRQMELTLEQQC